MRGSNRWCDLGHTNAIGTVPQLTLSFWEGEMVSGGGGTVGRIVAAAPKADSKARGEERIPQRRTAG
jgi:hypothetical protein